MKSIFITALAARDSVRDWDSTCLFLRETLFSLEQQSSPNFRSIICCHQVPDFAAQLDERFLFVRHPFPPPDSAYANTGKNSGLRDLMLKRDVALYTAQPEKDDLVAILDADDLYHRDLVSDFESCGSADAFLMERGYEFCQKTHRLLERSDMVSRTSSSFAMRAQHLRIPSSLDEQNLVGSLYHEVWHSNLPNFLKLNSLSVIAAKEPRVVYRVNTSLNRSDAFRKQLLERIRQRLKFFLGRRVSDRDRYNFGLEVFSGKNRG